MVTLTVDILAKFLIISSASGGDFFNIGSLPHRETSADSVNTRRQQFDQSEICSATVCCILPHFRWSEVKLNKSLAYWLFDIHPHLAPIEC